MGPAFFCAVLFVAPGVAQPSGGSTLSVPPDSGARPTVLSRASTGAELIPVEPVDRPNAWWVQASAMISPFDARRDVFIARWSPGVTVGRRYTRWGFFGQLEYDQTVDFTLKTESLHVINVGGGAEFLNFSGQVRSSLSAGASILAEDTLIDEAGETGFYIDLRPAGLRWAIGADFAFEFSPIGLDLIIPVTEGIPLVVYSYGTTLTMEWSIQ